MPDKVCSLRCHIEYPMESLTGCQMAQSLEDQMESLMGCQINTHRYERGISDGTVFGTADKIVDSISEGA